MIHILYKNIHQNLTKIYLRHDDIFITKIMGLIIMIEVLYFAIACGVIALVYGLITAKSVISVLKK